MLSVVNNLVEGTAAELARLRQKAKRQSTGSSDQVLPILEAADNLDIPIVISTTEELIEHSFNQGNNLGSSSDEVDMVPKPRTLGKKKAAGAVFAPRSECLTTSIRGTK